MSRFCFQGFARALARRIAPVALLGVALLASCSDDKEQTKVVPAATAAPAPTAVTFTQAGLYPEGAQYDAYNGQFLVTSLTTGRLGRVKDDGSYSAIFPDNPQLISSTGVYITQHYTALVAVSDPGTNPQRTSAATKDKLARLAMFSLTRPGTLPDFVELGTLRPALRHYAKDITVDAKFNAYVTDSYANIIYKIDNLGLYDFPSVFLEDAARLGTPAAGAFGFTGIVYHPNEYLLVAKADNGTIYKVPLSNPTSYTPVAINVNLSGAEGLYLQNDNTLLVVSQTQAKAFRLASTDSFTSATLTGTFDTLPLSPTAFATRGDASYVLHSNREALFAGRTPAASQFTLTRVNF